MTGRTKKIGGGGWDQVPCRLAWRGAAMTFPTPRHRLLGSLTVIMGTIFAMIGR